MAADHRRTDRCRNGCGRGVGRSRSKSDPVPLDPSDCGGRGVGCSECDSCPGRSRRDGACGYRRKRGRRPTPRAPGHDAPHRGTDPLVRDPDRRITTPTESTPRRTRPGWTVSPRAIRITHDRRTGSGTAARARLVEPADRPRTACPSLHGRAMAERSGPGSPAGGGNSRWSTPLQHRGPRWARQRDSEKEH